MPLIHYSASIQDGLGSRKTVDAYLNPADLTGEPAGFDAWLIALDAVITGVIVAGQVRVTPTLPTTLANSGRAGFADSRVEENGEIRFNLSGTPKHYTQAIPAVADTAVVAGKLSLTSITAYTAVMTGGSFTDNTGLARITTVYGGFLGTRKVRKQLQRSSFTGT